MRCRSRRWGSSFLGQVGADVLAHVEAEHLVRAEDLGHLPVGGEVLLVVGVLGRGGKQMLRSLSGQSFLWFLTWRLFFLM